jgi:predicted ATPase with chaperone activity
MNATATTTASDPQPATPDMSESVFAPHLPPMFEREDGTFAPRAPLRLEETGVEATVLRELAIKLTCTVPNLRTDWAAEQLCLPLPVTEEIFWSLKQDRLVEILGQQGHLNYNYAATQRGREHAARLFEVCGYVGPAPVSLESYSAMLEWQHARFPLVTLEDVQRALGSLVISADAVQVAALAASAGRSLFLFGPPGNGKTSVGRALHKALQGELWVPHCISVGSTIIRVYDRHYHLPAPGEEARKANRCDRRWLHVTRPFVVAGGEMTIEELDLTYNAGSRFYEAPPHAKANGGMFLIDDLGRQRVDPHELLNRWIIPLEHGFDLLSLRTGQKIQVPFHLLLVVATNLTVSDVADPAFLRRMGYRLHLSSPDEASYAKILQRYAAHVGVEPSAEVVDAILQRYRIESRELRASEPRDLIERARDICRMQRRPLELNQEILEIAWRGYFGHDPTRAV